MLKFDNSEQSALWEFRKEYIDIKCKGYESIRPTFSELIIFLEKLFL